MPYNKNPHRTRLTSSSKCLLAFGLLACVQSTPIMAQTPTQEYRVGNLIENGFFGEPKGWKLTNFGVDKGSGISRKGQEGAWGHATTTFLGPDGHYKIRVRYQDEGDGVSQARVLVGENLVGSWAFDGILVNTYLWKEFDGVPIKKGDEITISGRAGGYEYARITGIEILPSKPLAAVAEADVIEQKQYSMNLVPLPEQSRGGPQYLLNPNPFFTGGNGTYQIYLKVGQRFPLTAWAGHAGTIATLDYSLTKAGGETPVVAETLESQSSQPIRVNLRAAEAGLYELKVAAAPTAEQRNVRINFDVPGVSSLPAGEGYFYVPKATQVLSVRANGHTVIQDANGKVMLDEWFDKVTARVIEVPAGSDNQLWYFQGALSGLTGVPPHIAARREAMLVPAEVLQ